MTKEAADALLPYLKALVALQLETLSDRSERTKPEVVLARAGMPAREIAAILGKNAAAVAKALQRSGKGAK